MKRLEAILAVAVLAVGATCGSASATQILNNTSFETAPTVPPTPNDWQYNGQAVRDSSNPHTGSYDAYLDNTTEASNSNVLQQTAFGSVTPNTVYTLGLYSEATYGVGGIGQAQLEFMNSSGGVIATDFLPNLPSSATYTYSSGSFTAPPNSSAAFVLIGAITGAISGSTSQVYVDDVTLTSASTPEPASIALLIVGGAGLMARRRAH